MIQRRTILKSGLFLAASSLSLPTLAKNSSIATGDCCLRFYNTHTGEKLTSTFWAEGEFVPDSLHDINKVLRDHRTNKVADIDPQLLLLLGQLNGKLDNSKELHIISGYRAPESNAFLRGHGSGGVAKRSLHMDGKAIDIRLPGTDLRYLQKAAMSLQGGGVGYYASSQFVHMDTGRVRYW
jgi:uncharacterized protein YcbK (DUF882 family)